MRNGLVSGLPGDALIIATWYITRSGTNTCGYVSIGCWADSKKRSMGALGSVVPTCSMLSITLNYIETRQTAELPYTPKKE